MPSFDEARRNVLERGLNRILEVLCVLCLAAIFVVVVLLVGLRYVFNSSITGANELIVVLFVYSTAIGSAIAIGRREHIAVGAFVEQLSKRRRRAVDSLGLVAIAVLHVVLLWHSLSWIGTTGSFLMPSTELPRFVTQVSVPVGSTLSIAYCVLRLLGEAPSEKDGSDA
ncbi:MAG: TRAP transporter small permease [Planctomycetota bacterium]